jgi:hypothetical protein
MDDFICNAVFYCFGLDQELLLGTVAQRGIGIWMEETSKLDQILRHL